MKFLLFAVLIVGALSCDYSKNENEQFEKTINDSVMGYPKIIDSLQIRNLYDKAKWTMYCIYCKDTCVANDSTSTRIMSFASLDLKFNKLSTFNDTIEIEFCFYSNDNFCCERTTKGPISFIATGIGFKRGSDSIIYYTSSTTMGRFWEKGPTSIYDNPLQPHTLNFIKINMEKLNPWFKNEAKKRKIIK